MRKQISSVFVVFVVSYEALASWPNLNLSIMSIYCSWNVLWVMLSRPLMWPCYRGDVMTLGFPMMIGGYSNDGTWQHLSLFLSGITSSGMMSSGGVVLVPVHIWKPSKISLTNAYLYLHAYVAFVITDDKHASWLFLFDTVVKCLCVSINAKSLQSFITYNCHFIILNWHKAFDATINKTHFNSFNCFELSLCIYKDCFYSPLFIYFYLHHFTFLSRLIYT